MEKNLKKNEDTPEGDPADEGSNQLYSLAFRGGEQGYEEPSLLSK